MTEEVDVRRKKTRRYVHRETKEPINVSYNLSLSSGDVITKNWKKNLIIFNLDFLEMTSPDNNDRLYLTMIGSFVSRWTYPRFFFLRTSTSSVICSDPGYNFQKLTS